MKPFRNLFTTILLVIIFISKMQIYGFEVGVNEHPDEDYSPHAPEAVDEVEDDEHENGAASNIPGFNPTPRRTNSRKMSYPKLDTRPFLTHLHSEMSRPRGKCDRKIRILNGVTRIRDRGTLIRFQCSYGYFMVGAGLAVCVRGQWSDSPPLCVRGGCRKLPIPVHGSLRQLYGNGLAMFTCSYGYMLEGSPLLTCDGTRWNGTAPNCEPMMQVTLSPPTTTFPTIPLEIITPEPEAENKTASVIVPYHEIDVTINPHTVISSTTEQQQISTRTMQVQTQQTTESTTSTFTPPSPTTVKEPTTEHPISHSLDFTTDSIISTTHNSYDITTSKAIILSSNTDYVLIATEKSIISPSLNPILPSSTVSTSNETIFFNNASSTDESPTEVSNISSSTENAIQGWVEITLTPSSTTKPLSLTSPAPTSQTSTPTLSSIVTTTISNSQEYSTVLGPSPTFSTIHEVISISPESRLDFGEDTINVQKPTDKNSSNNTNHQYLMIGLAFSGVCGILILTLVIRYFWRKHKGIARAGPTDLDGKTLQFHEGSDEIIWSDGNSYCSRL